ncbi:putative L-ornithine-N5-monooxygenase [Lentinula raphanica]|uniref:L-ornithine N(5)-monooxygenase [NAD(P)H] n=1 Tax=Lentinula raphanica TaxID=153919 RepID=A0AA38UHG2_9AGAR|nr:putative L-ornithine-N5-monooxygenase [Lentinula raphanica]KAJ3971353.1 putative L-ornithine-N5-monooxygenase [Lentinula raphanica]
MTFIYDLIGVGFGPSNLALSGALIEKRATSSNESEQSFRNTLFFEKQSSFQWHPGMLLPGAQMQISFLKDLAMLRSPQSPLTFVNYLHCHKRLSAFIDRGSFTPSRKEFADYLKWAARYVKKHGVNVNYGQEVVTLDESDEGLITVTTRCTSNGQLNQFVTRNLVLSPGGSANIPGVLKPLLKDPSITDRSTFLHSSEYKDRVVKLLNSVTSDKQRPLKIAVIGGGQSSAEVTINLRDLLSNVPFGKDSAVGHQIDMLIRKGSLKPSDDSQFSNDIFAPESTHNWFNTCEQGRERLMAEYKDTNYSVVNPRTIAALHEILYDQKIDDAIAARNPKSQKPCGPRINIRPHTGIISPSRYDEGSKTFSLALQNMQSGEVFEDQTYDAIICATGYQRYSWIDMFRASERLSQRFGLGNDAPIRLVPFSQQAKYVVDPRGHDSSFPNAPSPGSSAVTTPISSASADDIVQQQTTPMSLYITRRYRLLPIASTEIDSEKALKARIYIQGLEETTHGLSDTLLSVISCRAGEIVDDLFTED